MMRCYVPIGHRINNAGINGGRVEFQQVPIDTVEAVVKVNLLGALLCTHYAMKLLSSQQGVTSHIFNTVGSGVKGGCAPPLALWLATSELLPCLQHVRSEPCRGCAPSLEKLRQTSVKHVTGARRDTCATARRSEGSPR